MISVDEAVSRVVAAFAPLKAERIAVGAAMNRVLAEDAIARHSQPPLAVSAMDGYAVRASDAANAPVELCVIGSAPAGHPFEGLLGAGEAVRIFTGGVVPSGADTIVIQEDAESRGKRVFIGSRASPGRHIRDAGLDFEARDVLAQTGKRLTARDLALLAAGDLSHVMVRQRPHVVIVATGDELSPPGEPRKSGGIVASSAYGISALIDKWGGIPRDLGILPDRIESIESIATLAADAHLIVTLGGASVGDHDLVQRALGPKGFVLDFWKVAMRPGKPLIFGRLGNTPLLGLPGNPVSAFVCALLFLKPAIAAMLGAATDAQIVSAHLVSPLPTNDSRQDYLRARLSHNSDGMRAEAFRIQDSSMQRELAEADGLIIRPPYAPTACKGDIVPVILLE